LVDLRFAIAAVRGDRAHHLPEQGLDTPDRRGQHRRAGTESTPETNFTAWRPGRFGDVPVAEVLGLPDDVRQGPLIPPPTASAPTSSPHPEHRSTRSCTSTDGDPPQAPKP